MSERETVYLYLCYTGALLIDRLFEYIDWVSAGTVSLYTICWVVTGYVKSIEFMFFILLAQGTLDTFFKVGKD